MSRENIYSAIILKKQAYGEADEIVTFYTRELGKLRAKASSSKLPFSRLGPALQAFFLVNLRVAGTGLAKITGAAPINSFPRLQEDVQRAGLAFVAAEIVMRATPDEQKNEELFDLLAGFLTFLDTAETARSNARAGLVKFKAGALDALGLGLPDQGAKTLAQTPFSDLDPGSFNVDALDQTLTDFIAYQLEREIRSERFLRGEASVV